MTDTFEHGGRVPYANGLQQWMPTPVFESFWRFAAERQAIYLRRIAGAPPPWTDDPILAEYRFTNVYRAADRVSQSLIADIQYDGQKRSPADIVLRTLLFKIFNRLETWCRLSDAVGELSADNFHPAACTAVLDEAVKAGERVYSGAYIVPPVPGVAGERKHAGHLHLLGRMLDAGGIEELAQATSLQELYEQLLRWPGLGPFLAYQFAIDLNYSSLFDFDENDFIVAGPGAVDGISKCFASLDGARPETVIHAVWRSQQDAFAVRGLDFGGLWGRPMSLIDVQNVFCEIGKYARVAHPEAVGRSGRVRIKQRYRPAGPIPRPTFPPKWQVSVGGGLSTRDELDRSGRRISHDQATTLLPNFAPDVVCLEEGVLPLRV